MGCNAEVGYWIGQAHWGRGITSEALQLVTDWAWDAQPALTQSGQHRSQSPRGGGRVRRAHEVHDHYRARSHAGERLACDRGRVPQVRVPGDHVPLHGLLAERGDQVEVARAMAASGEAEVARL